ncbi:MAG TPA: ABC transporter permease [Dehalococcoidia bacterium]
MSADEVTVNSARRVVAAEPSGIDDRWRVRPRPTPFALAVALPHLWLRRELLFNMTVRSIRVQYKQSVLGYAWLLLNPLAQLGTLTFVFTVVFHASNSGNVPFILFLAAGLFPWNFFSAAVSHATESVISASRIIDAVYFPREFLVVSTILIRLVDFAVTLLILFGAMLAYGYSITWTAAWVPLIFAMQLTFTVGLSLPLAGLNLFFHDVRYLVGVLLNLWFFFTPIFYSVDSVPSRYRVIYELNPMARFVGAYREALLDHGSPALGGLVLAFAGTGLTLAVGYYLFRLMEPHFADRA